MEEPTGMTRYLGCEHDFSSSGETGNRTKKCVYSIAEYFRSAVEIYVETTGNKVHAVDTPYVPEVSPLQWQELTSSPGKHGKSAAMFLMKLLYGARMCRPDLCVAVQRLAAQVTRWSGECDRRLHRLYCYVFGSAALSLSGSLNESDKSCLRLVAWPDADLNGDVMSSKSTSGFFLELAGAGGRAMPLAWGSKRQGCTSSHTCEAEVVSLSSALRTELLPAQVLLEVILGRPVEAVLKEDNSATIVSCNKGYSPAMRYVNRTQRVSLGFINDILKKEEVPGEGKVVLEKAPTLEHKGDMFTKAIDTSAKFKRALEMIQMG
jgi:hypothetical protein